MTNRPSVINLMHMSFCLCMTIFMRQSPSSEIAESAAWASVSCPWALPDRCLGAVTVLFSDSGAVPPGRQFARDGRSLGACVSREREILLSVVIVRAYWLGLQRLSYKDEHLCVILSKKTKKENQKNGWEETTGWVIYGICKCRNAK